MSVSALLLRRMLAPLSLAALLATSVLAGCTSDRVAPGPTGTGAARPASASTRSSGCGRPAARPATYRYADRPGVDADVTSLDVYLPPGCGPFPTVVWVHGGGWRQGDRANRSVVQQAAWANGLGIAWVSVGYRLSTPGSRVAWPDHGDDVADAVA